jgi:flagellar biosynthetic protein FlhB
MGGWSFSAEAVAPKLEKLSPIAGMKRMFSVRSLVEMLKSLMKFSIVLGFMFLLSRVYLDDFIALSRLPLESAFIRASDMMLLSFVVLCASLLLVVVVDVPFSLWEHKKKLKMTRQEIKDEMKQTEGRPEVKSRVRQLQQEIAQGRMMEQVPQADVIVTNPTHYAVALKYEEGSNGAPRVVAKGADLIAAQIRNIGIGSGVELVSMPPLARALYHTTKIDDEVPRGLYLAVAQVLAYVFQLRVAKEKRWKKPQPPKDIKIPDEYQKYR